MKKTYLISLIAVLLLIVGITLYGIMNKPKLYIITLDINPSIQINFNKEKKVKKVVALNEDAKKIISDDFKNMSLNKTLNIIVENVANSEFVTEDEVSIIFYSDGDIDKDEIINSMRNSFDEKNIYADVIVVDKITSKDRKLAKKYNISPAKISYINSVIKENNNIEINNLADRSVRELRETKENGWYCDEGYILEGTNCLKEKSRTPASIGEVCPRGYYMYNNKCYEETAVLETGKLICDSEYVLKDKKCIKEEVIAAEPNYICQTGELHKLGDFFPEGDVNHEETYCVDKKNAKAPTLRCLTHNHTMINGKCANGPKPTINGGCIEGDYLVNGGCYDIDNEDQWVCPDGRIYEKSKGTYVELCPDTFTYTKPTINGYKCNEGFKLKDNKCVRTEKIDPHHERYCPDGYSLTNNDKCINYSNIANKQNGYVCDNEADRLNGNICISYEMINAKK